MQVLIALTYQHFVVFFLSQIYFLWVPSFPIIFLASIAVPYVAFIFLFLFYSSCKVVHWLFNNWVCMGEILNLHCKISSSWLSYTIRKIWTMLFSNQYKSCTPICIHTDTKAVPAPIKVFKTVSIMANQEMEWLNLGKGTWR
jgi:hypothetical protein